MNDNISNTSIYGTDDFETIQMFYEDISTRERLDNSVEYEEDTYTVNPLETCVDLCEAGFVLINNRVYKRD